MAQDLKDVAADIAADIKADEALLDQPELRMDQMCGLIDRLFARDP
jgi:hypothetical protein